MLSFSSERFGLYTGDWITRTHLIVPQRREREQVQLSAMGLTTGLGGAVVNSLLWFLDSFLAFFLERFDNTEKTNHRPDLMMA